MSRTIAVEATEEYAPVDCYEVCAVTTTTMHYGAVGDGTLGAHGDGRQQGTSKRLCLALACRSSIVKQGLPDLVMVQERMSNNRHRVATPKLLCPGTADHGWPLHSGTFQLPTQWLDWVLEVVSQTRSFRDKKPSRHTVCHSTNYQRLPVKHVLPDKLPDVGKMVLLAWRGKGIVGSDKTTKIYDVVVTRPDVPGLHAGKHGSSQG